MFPNLRAEMARRGIGSKGIAEAAEISLKSANNKLNGRNDFTLREMLAIRDKLFDGFTLDYLFLKRPSSQLVQKGA